jgi:hypothetical protein
MRITRRISKADGFTTVETAEPDLSASVWISYHVLKARETPGDNNVPFTHTLTHAPILWPFHVFTESMSNLRCYSPTRGFP